MASWLSWIALAAGLTGPSEGLVLEWTAPSSCPPTVDVRRTVIEALGGVAAEGWRAEVTVTERPDGFDLTTTLHGPAGSSRRTLSASSCEEAVDATALLVALAVTGEPPAEPPAQTPEAEQDAVPEVGPSVETERDAPTVDDPDDAGDPRAPTNEAPPIASVDDGPPADDPATPEQPVVPSDDSGSRRRAGRALRFTAVAAGGLGAVAVPSATGWLAADIGLGRGPWAIDIGVREWLPRSSSVQGDIEGRFAIHSAHLRGCGVPRGAWWSVPLCGGVALGGVTGRGTRGLARVDRAVQPWIGATASAALRVWPWARLGFVARMEGALALARPRLEIGGVGVVCCARFGVGAGLGVVARWGNGSPTVRTITRRAGPWTPSS